jgi:hypothetical protein
MTATVSLRKLAAFIATHLGAELTECHSAEHREPLAEYRERNPDRPLQHSGKWRVCLPCPIKAYANDAMGRAVKGAALLPLEEERDICA